MNSINIAEHEGNVLLQFPQLIQEAQMTPEEARQLGEKLARVSYHAHYGVEPPKVESALKAHIRQTLITRTKLIMNNLQEKKKHPEFIAAEIVDSVLSAL